MTDLATIDRRALANVVGGAGDGEVEPDAAAQPAEPDGPAINPMAGAGPNRWHAKGRLVWGLIGSGEASVAKSDWSTCFSGYQKMGVPPADIRKYCGRPK